jgi:nicotinamidase-related amidase
MLRQLRESIRRRLRDSPALPPRAFPGAEIIFTSDDPQFTADTAALIQESIERRGSRVQIPGKPGWWLVTEVSSERGRIIYRGIMTGGN